MKQTTHETVLFLLLTAYHGRIAVVLGDLTDDIRACERDGTLPVGTLDAVMPELADTLDTLSYTLGTKLVKLLPEGDTPPVLRCGCGHAAAAHATDTRICLDLRCRCQEFRQEGTP